MPNERNMGKAESLYEEMRGRETHPLNLTVVWLVRVATFLLARYIEGN